MMAVQVGRRTTIQAYTVNITIFLSKISSCFTMMSDFLDYYNFLLCHFWVPTYLP